MISPALIATLPGMALAIGAIELAGGRIISGASRSVYGIAQLALLVYGAMVAIPFALLASRLRGAPPASVLTLAAFWSLVPGQLTFMSVSRHAAGDIADTAGNSVAAGAIVSIALGTIVGWSLVRTLSGPPRRPSVTGPTGVTPATSVTPPDH